MSLKLIRAASKAENSDELHMARILLLLNAFDRNKDKHVEGIMKLAKLDFLLRYPNCLSRVMDVKNISSESAKIQPYEKNSIETKMYRFRYGPWDDRYRRWIGILMAKGLATTFLKGNTVYVGVTTLGKTVAAELFASEAFAEIGIRSEIITKAVGDFSATKLKEFIYENFPEIVNMKWGEDITI